MVGWHHRLNGQSFEQTPGDNREAWQAAVHGVAKRHNLVIEQQRRIRANLFKVIALGWLVTQQQM